MYKGNTAGNGSVLIYYMLSIVGSLFGMLLDTGNLKCTQVVPSRLSSVEMKQCQVNGNTCASN